MEMLSEGAEIRSTKLTETFGYSDFYKKHFRRAVPLFALNPKGRILVFTPDIEIDPGPGWTLISLILPSKEEKVGELTDKGGTEQESKA